MSKIIFIIGMSGAGKTKWGEQIATHFQLPFFDTDHFIETKQNKSITQLFFEIGEPGFRKLESEALSTIVHENQPPFVLSCGGGTPITPSNFAFMKEHGTLVYLRAAIPTILENLRDYMSARPMLTNGVINPTVRLTELYEKRRRIYEQADYTFDVERLQPEDFAPVIAGLGR